VNVPTVPNGVYTDGNGIQYPFISDYAPNLTVYFRDSSEAHTFPISSYHWDFGDPYNEGPMDITDIRSNYYTVTGVALSSGNFNAPCWVTNKQGATAVHTYIMPGAYDVTLTVRASNTGTSDICARYTQDDAKTYYVYVQEIPAQCNDSVKVSYLSASAFTNTVAVSGISPVTAYFMASGIIAGSFPICRIDWDFGDGTIQRVTRTPLMTATSDGLPFVWLSAYSYDLLDPRNVVVPHIFINDTRTTQTFDVHISAFACNTNTMLHCSAAALVGPIDPASEREVTETKKLLGSRIDESGNLIYIIEGQNELTTHTVILTGELT